MTVTIEKASLSQLAELMAWRMEVLAHVFETPQEEITRQHYQANEEYYRRHLSDGSHIAVFARQDDQPVGCAGLCLYQEMPSPDNLNGLCGYIMNVYVRQEYRRQGIARELVTALIQEAQQRGVTKIYLETSVMGRPLYEVMGFKPMKDYYKYEHGNKTV